MDGERVYVPLQTGGTIALVRETGEIAWRNASGGPWPPLLVPSLVVAINTMEVIAIDPGHAAMTMAHIFTKADVGDDEQVRVFLLDCAHRLLNDAFFRVSAGSLLILFVRNTKKNNCLDASLGGVPGFRRDLVWRELLDPRHTADCASLRDPFAYEEREDKIARSESGFAHEVTKCGSTAQTTRAADQFLHLRRLIEADKCGKLTRGRDDKIRSPVFVGARHAVIFA